MAFEQIAGRGEASVGGRGLKPPTPRTPLVAKGKEDEKRGEKRKKKREEEERAPLGSEAGFATADRYR